jgi:hypothetical protein
MVIKFHHGYIAVIKAYNLNRFLVIVCKLEVSVPDCVRNDSRLKINFLNNVSTCSSTSFCLICEIYNIDVKHLVCIYMYIDYKLRAISLLW